MIVRGLYYTYICICHIIWLPIMQLAIVLHDEYIQHTHKSKHIIYIYCILYPKKQCNLFHCDSERAGT